MKSLLVVFAIAITLVGCKDETTHTKQWYVDHDSERQARVKVCENDASERATADCQNAIEADRSVWALGKDPKDNSAPKVTY